MEKVTAWTVLLSASRFLEEFFLDCCAAFETLAPLLGRFALLTSDSVTEVEESSKW